MGALANLSGGHRTASQCRVVVHENVWTVSDWTTLVECIYEDKKLAVLKAGRVKIFVVVPAELPIVEKSRAEQNLST
jgi:hypothetical protein